MKRSARPRRTPSELSGSVRKRLNMYALAASAAGVSLLALAPTVEGKIVYTPANVKLHGPFPLDLNHDGTADFLILLSSSAAHSSIITALSVCHDVFLGSRGSYQCSSKTSNLNAVRVAKTSGQEAAAALRAGAKVQNGDRFRDRNPVGMGRVFDRTDTSTQPPHWSGAWVNEGKGVKNRYLGLKFKINGKFHFGWARLTVTTQSTTFTATLTGYAYETIPGKGIIAGQTWGSEEVEAQPPSAAVSAPVRQSATLGMLAVGEPGLSIWRRKESAAAVRQ
jgi:hypothetical protein